MRIPSCVLVHIAVAKESCTDDEIIAEDLDEYRDGEIVIEYIELEVDVRDPTQYRECLI